MSLPRINLCTKTFFPSFVKRPNTLSVSETIEVHMSIGHGLTLPRIK
ncbi:hypothetical protein CJF31_00003830 [Rutstroemia sp. NJR-2017a BVV2]|nr:hypothetical protein CJF31_00003830 [Rutstroemia sp. NJR-2017a BVV2]